MRRIILPSVTCPAVPHYPTLSNKRHHYRDKVFGRIMIALVFFLQILSVTFLTLRRTERDIIVEGNLYKYLVHL